MAIHNFDDLVEAIANAVVHARQVTERQHLSILKNYFDIKDEKRVAKTIKILIPNHSGEGDAEIEIDVPLITLVPFNSLVLSDVEIEFEAFLSSLEGGGKEGKKKSLQMNLGGKGVIGKKTNNVKIKIVLKGSDPPEGVVKINDHILKYLP